jgi:PAP2 superfamily
MGTYQVVEVFCTVEGWFGWAVFGVILLFQRAWYIITGISFMDNRLWLAFLVIYVYWQGIYVNWLLTVQFDQPRPRCSLIQDVVLESYRSNGMPSTEAQLSFSLSAFLLMQMALSGKWANAYIILGMIWLPFVVSGAMYTSHNNTGAQIIFGAVLGIVNSVLVLLVYRYFAQEGLALITQNNFIRRVVPMNIDD